MKILVTGGCGFIGSNFIRYWLEQHPEDQITNIDALTYAGNPANLAELENNPHYRFVKGDITDRELANQTMAGHDTVVHFAAESHVDRSILDASPFVTTNVLGTQVLLEAARQNDIKRFHHVSTDEVFGTLELNTPDKFRETTPINPHSPYAASKASSDLLVKAYFDTHGLPVTISNTSNNYGPYQYPEKLIPLMILKARAEQPLPVYGDGQSVRDWIHVLDHCRAIELILAKGKIGETYCVGGDAERSALDVVKDILQLMKKDESLISFVTDRPGHDRRYAIDSTKIKTELGFTHAHTWETGLAETVKWYQEHEDWWAPLLNDDYKQYLTTQYGQK
jgi:dTDP-glucose 4,6-dehydratase